MQYQAHHNTSRSSCCAHCCCWRAGRRTWWCRSQGANKHVKGIDEYASVFHIMHFGMLKVKMHEVMFLWFVCLQEETADYVARNMWYPVYSPLVHEKWDHIIHRRLFMSLLCFCLITDVLQSTLLLSSQKACFWTSNFFYANKLLVFCISALDITTKGKLKLYKFPFNGYWLWIYLQKPL